MLMKFSVKPALNHYQMKLTRNIAIMSNRNAKGYSIHVIHCTYSVCIFVWLPTITRSKYLKPHVSRYC